MSLSILGLVLLSAALHAAWSVSIKGSREPLAFNVLQKIVHVALIGFGWALIDLGDLPAGLWPILAATGVAHGLYLFWLSRAFERADLSLVYPIVRSTPAFVPLVAVPLFGEGLSFAGAVGIAIVVAGLWTLHWERALGWRGFLGAGTVFAYLTLLSTVAYSVLDKAAVDELDAATWSSGFPRSLVLYFLIVGAGSLVFFPLALPRTPIALLRRVAREEWPRVIAAVAFTISSYALILEALRSAPVSYVVATRQISVLFALFLGMRLLGERPGPRRALGALATVVGVGLIGVLG